MTQPQRSTRTARTSPARKSRHSLVLSEENGVLFLHFGSPWVQGAMRISRPTALELDYTRDMMAGLLLRSTPPRTVLQIGLGAASTTKFLQRYFPACRQTVVEIDERVVRLAEQSFRFRPGANIRVVMDDGVQWLKTCPDRFDLIFIDGFDADAKPGALNTERFYELCRAHLSTRGILVVNLLRRSQFTKLGVERILSAFDSRVLALPATEDGNTVVFATVGDSVDVSSVALARRIATLKARTGLDLQPLRERLLARDGKAAIRF